MTLATASFAIALGVFASGGSPGGRPPSPRERGRVPERESRSPSRIEHFVLEMRDAGAPSSDRAARDVGLACFRRNPIEGGSRGGVQLECECLFRREGGLDDDRREDEHVLHVEQLTSAGPRLVWREWGPGRARSLTLERIPEGRDLRTIDSGRGASRRETLASCEGAVMPLELLDLCREGLAEPRRYLRFDPLASRLETVELRTLRRDELEGGMRTVEIVREDGTLAGRFEFRGTDLQSFCWQDSGLVARRVSAEEYSERSGPLAPAEPGAPPDDPVSAHPGSRLLQAGDSHIRRP